MARSVSSIRERERALEWRERLPGILAVSAELWLQSFAFLCSQQRALVPGHHSTTLHAPAAKHSDSSEFKHLEPWPFHCPADRRAQYRFVSPSPSPSPFPSPSLPLSVLLSHTRINSWVLSSSRRPCASRSARSFFCYQYFSLLENDHKEDDQGGDTKVYRPHILCLRTDSARGPIPPHPHLWRSLA
jgi:hypothetical protein